MAIKFLVKIEFVMIQITAAFEENIIQLEQENLDDNRSLLC